VGSVAVVGGACLVLSLHAGRQAKDTVQRGYTELTVIKQGDLDAMRLLRELDTQDAAVLNQEPDGSIWMYAQVGLRPLVTQFIPAGDSSTSTTDRVWLAEHVQDFGQDPRVAELLDRYGIGYVFVNEVTNGNETPWINLGAVAANPRFVEVVHRGTSHVFQVAR